MCARGGERSVTYDTIHNTLRLDTYYEYDKISISVIIDN